MTVINAWIKPGTTIISDCWSAYRNLDAQGYTHRTVNHTIAFVNEEGDHTNTIESKWGHVKAYLKSYKRPDDCIYHFAHYMFAARCKAEGVHQFTKFLHLVASTDWSCLEGRVRKVLRPATSTQVFLGFPVSMSKCWDGTQDATTCFSCSPPQT